MDLPDSVRAAITETFGHNKTAAVTLMLPAREHLPLNPPYERVLLAVVGLADGDLTKVAHYSQVAIEDWRDVLYWWETPELAQAASPHVAERPDIEEDLHE